MKILFYVTCFSLFTSTPVLAFGSKRQQAPASNDRQAFPTRLVQIDEFNKTQFTLPDGETKVDMSVYLPELVLTEVVQATNRLRIQAHVEENEDASPRYIMRGGLTSFEASNMSGSVRFGYKPSAGDLGNSVAVGVNGKVEYNIGSLDFNFHIVDTVRREVVAAGRGSAVTSGVNLKVGMDFSKSSGEDVAADFVFNSPLTKSFRTAVRAAILQMANDAKTNFYMDWMSTISRVDYSEDKVYFRAGARDNLNLNEIFTVYDYQDERIGEIKIVETSHEKSVAKYKDDAARRKILSTNPGDILKIFYLKK